MLHYCDHCQPVTFVNPVYANVYENQFSASSFHLKTPEIETHRIALNLSWQNLNVASAVVTLLAPVSTAAQKPTALLPSATC